MDYCSCSVYQLIDNIKLDSYVVCGLSKDDRTFRKSRTFKAGDLVAVNRATKQMAVTPDDNCTCTNASGHLNPGKHNGPILQLSDNSGLWIFEGFNRAPIIKVIPVYIGLWVFYVGNIPFGMSPRSHPIDRLDFRVRMLEEEEADSASSCEFATYPPLHKLYCDRKVTNPTTGTNYYRVQGTLGWVFDRQRRRQEPKDKRDANEGDILMLLEESKVTTGAHAFRCLDGERIEICAWPSLAYGTGEHISPGQIVAVDMIQESHYHHGNGPFLRLMDGSGWLYINKRNKKLMEEVTVTSGKWAFKVYSQIHNQGKNAALQGTRQNPSGIVLYRHPIDNPKMRSGRVLPVGQLIECDLMIESKFPGATFYRVHNTNDWIYDKRDGPIMLAPRSSAHDLPLSHSSGLGWNSEFVRGIAFCLDDLAEIAFDERKQIISFRHVKGARIDIQYTTRTIVTAMDHPTQGRSQLFRRDCNASQLRDVLTDPFKHQGDAYYRQHFLRTIEDPYFGSGYLLEAEEEARTDLFTCDKEFQKFHKLRTKLLNSIQSFEEKRWSKSTRQQQEAERRSGTSKVLGDTKDQ